MSSPNINRDNYQLLSHMKPGQNIGSDHSGRVYLIQERSLLTNIVRKIFQDTKELQQIVQGFVIEKLHEKKFHDATSGRDAYLALLNQFSQNQLSITQKSAIAFDYYNSRFRDFIAGGMERFRAECQIVLEMCRDPNIPEDFKRDIAPEVTQSIIYLKDRAGKKIATIPNLSASIAEARLL